MAVQTTGARGAGQPARRAGAGRETPSSVMYADLKLFGRISNRDAARLLLSPTYPIGSIPIRERINDRTFLSRDVVHARPQAIVPQRFADIPQASLTLAAKVIAYLGGDEQARARFLRHYQDEAPRAMRASLDENGLEGTAYANALAKIERVRFSPEKDHGLLYFMLFVATGCLCDPARAAQTVEEFATRQLASELHTIETSVGSAFPPSLDAPAAEARPAGMGLLRVIDGMVKPPLRKLSGERSGTVIGALASGPHGISDVDGDVSRRHLRIWREDGSWWAQGLGTTNGSTLISGDTREVRVIEPPRREREKARSEGANSASTDERAGASEEAQADGLWPPVEIMNSDMLCLGATTRFLVMQITE